MAWSPSTSQNYHPSLVWTLELNYGETLSMAQAVFRYLHGICRADKPIRPISLHYLAQGCSFLLAGSLTDVLGSRKVFLSGCILQSICYLASGFSQSGVQLIAFRILSGVAYPMCFVSAMNIHSESFIAGKLHNLSLSCTRGVQYVGSVVGMILGGVLSVNAGWRWGFHCAAALSMFTLLLSIWVIPKQVDTKRVSWVALTEDIDWAGTLLATLLMAFLFSALAYVSPRSP
jgi:MFS family permease